MHRLKDALPECRKVQQLSEIVTAVELIEHKLNEIRKSLKKQPFTDAQISLMSLLIRNPKGISIKEISEALHISSSAVVQQIESFGKLKMIDRKQSKSDKRTTIAFIGKEGKRYIRENLEKYTSQYDERIFKILTEKEIDNLNEILQKVADYIQPKQNNKKK